MREELRAFAERLVRDPEYVESLRQRLVDGDLPAAIEVLLWELAFPRPPRQRVPVSVPGPRRELALVTPDAPVEERMPCQGKPSGSHFRQ